MNRIFIIILVFFSLHFFSLTLAGQDLAILDLTDGATWSHNECDYSSNYGAVYKLKILGDTVLNSQVYRKIYYQAKRGPTVCSNCNFVFNRDSASLFAFIREDISRRKVYFIHPSISYKEWLAYDFDIQNVGQVIAGFSLIFTTNPESTPVGIYVYQLSVDAIDSLCVNGEYEKRYYFGPGNGGNPYHLPEYWIEGIGSTHGLLDQGYGGPDWVHSLYCFYNSVGPVYFDSSAILSCVLNTSLSCEHGLDCSPVTFIDPPDQQDLVHVYPNPFSDRIFIESTTVIGTLTLAFYNLVGEKILVKTIPDAGELESVLISELPSGFYFLTIDGKNQFNARKIMKE